MVNFYQELKPFERFSAFTDERYYTEVPPDWWVVVTDIASSTEAIQKGNYKIVNLAGVASIVATLNACDSKMDLPYNFGGDGALVLIPDACREKVQKALSGLRSKVSDELGLDLRVALVPVSALHRAGKRLRVAKYALSEHVSQAIFRGSGIYLAEKWLKEGSEHAIFIEAEDIETDYNGLECRWEPVPAKRGEIVSIVVQLTDENEEETRSYEAIINDIRAIYKESFRPPLTESTMLFTLSPRKLLAEARLRAERGLERGKYVLVLIIQSLIGRLSRKFGFAVKSFNGQEYVKEVITNTDYRKFDGCLRMVLDGTQQQRIELQEMLQQRHAQGEICYGTHVSATALLTCLVYDYRGMHFHFIDGGNGGYAMAAKQLKEQMKTLKEKRNVA